MFLWAGVLAERLDCEALSTTERRTATARFGLPGFGKLWRQCDSASAEYGTFSLVKIQRFDAPGILHNMRRRELSTTAPDGHPTKGEDFSPPILASRMRYVGTW